MTSPLTHKIASEINTTTEQSPSQSQGVLPNSRNVSIKDPKETPNITSTILQAEKSSNPVADLKALIQASGHSQTANAVADASKNVLKANRQNIETKRASMEDKGYFLEIGDKGKERLDVLNSLTNNSSQNFLKKMGLRSGMNILEIGCGTGEMSIWLAKQVLPDGKVIAIDNSSEQIRLTQELAKKENISNIDFRVVSAYDLKSLGLNDQLDFVFSRYVFIHLIDHKSVLNALKGLVKPGSGVIVVQDLILNHIFSYPESEVVNEWRTLALKIYNHYNKDPDFGKKVVSLFSDSGLDVVDYEYHHPLLKTETEKLQMVRGTLESEKFLLEHQLASKEEIDLLVHKLEAIAKDNTMVISFMPNMIVAGKRTE